MVKSNSIGRIDQIPNTTQIQTKTITFIKNNILQTQNAQNLKTYQNTYQQKENNFNLAPGIRFSTEAKSKEIKQIVPGPIYDPINISQIYKSNKIRTFGAKQYKNEIIKKKQKSVNPGPGSYEAKAIIGNEGVKIGIHNKFKTKQTFQSPGPAYYTPQIPTIKPQQKKQLLRPKSITKLQQEQTPGPGKYMIQEIQTKKNMFSFGTSTRDGFKSQTLINRPQTAQPMKIIVQSTNPYKQYEELEIQNKSQEDTQKIHQLYDDFPLWGFCTKDAQKKSQIQNLKFNVNMVEDLPKFLRKQFVNNL